MKEKSKNIILSIVRFVPLIVCAVFMCVYLFSGRELTAEGLLNFAPEDPVFAALFLIALYALKSLTVFFPIIVLNVLGGFLFEPAHALIVNTVGVLVELAIPYWIGRASGASFAGKLCRKYPRLGQIMGEGSGSNFFITFFLRVISCLPGDAVSMYFGASRIPFQTYMLGSFLGVLPGMIAATLLGMNITEPGSPMFWVSVGLTVGISVVSFLVFYFSRKAKKRRDENMSKRWKYSLLGRRFLIILLLVLQLGVIIYTLASSSLASDIIGRGLTALSLLVCLYIVSRKDKGAYKLTWVFQILLFPVFGGLFYLMFRFQSATRKYAKRIDKTEAKAKALLSLPGTGYDEALSLIPEHSPQVRYLQDFAGFPIYMNSRTKYLTPGEEMLEQLVAELNKAEKYIFLEYFIVHEGVMWDTILDILKEKAEQGVKVRLMYDDIGCFFLLPKEYPKQMRKYGIECVVFNPFRPVLTTVQNNRDHRKIAVIDGKVAFTGGINLADEYINAIEKHGHWKDASIMVEGKAAWSFTLMFLQMWELCTDIDEDYAQYYPWLESECKVSESGFVQPYADSPMDKENIGEHVYLQIINNAKDYVYINTPYLIIDDSMISALCLAAKSGVDVRIVTPHKWDKRLVHMTTRSYYRELINAGVKIYEYSKGFIHSKTFVSDDTTATVGTTNLDFRSLYLHFECGVRMYKSNAVMEVKEDFVKTLEVCQPIMQEDCRCGIFMRLFQDILRLFAPLM